MSGLEFHHHAAKTLAFEAGELLRETERKLHASRALFALAAAEGESGNWAEAAEQAETLRERITHSWVGCAELGRF